MDIVNECLQSIAEDRRNFYTSRQIYIQDSRGLYKEYNNKVEKRNDGSRVRKNAVLAMVKFDIQRADLVRMAGAENLKGLALGHVSNVKTATARAFIREYMKNRANR